MSETKARVMPSALPSSEVELAEWNALTREEQIARVSGFFAHPDCETFTDETAQAQAHAQQTATLIDVAQVQGQVHAQSVHRVGELADRNPGEAAAIIRQWLAEPQQQ